MMTEWPAERQMILVKCGERDAATKSKDWPKAASLSFQRSPIHFICAANCPDRRKRRRPTGVPFAAGWKTPAGDQTAPALIRLFQSENPALVTRAGWRSSARPVDAAIQFKLVGANLNFFSTAAKQKRLSNSFPSVETRLYSCNHWPALIRCLVDIHRIKCALNVIMQGVDWISHQALQLRLQDAATKRIHGLAQYHQVHEIDDTGHYYFN